MGSLRLLTLMARLSWRRDAAFRTDALLRFLSGFLEFVILLCLYGLALSHVGKPPGWDYPDMVLLLAATDLVDSVFGFACSSLARLPSHVLDGTLDRLLLVPVPTLVLVSFNRFRWDYVFRFPVPILAMVWAAVSKGMLLSLPRVLGYVAALLCGFVLRWALTATVASLSLLLVRVDSLFYLISEVIGLARYPSAVFPGFCRMVFYVIPILFIANVPVSVLTSPNPWRFLLYALTAATVWGVIADRAFVLCLHRYTGVS